MCEKRFEQSACAYDPQLRRAGKMNRGGKRQKERKRKTEAKLYGRAHAHVRDAVKESRED